MHPFFIYLSPSILISTGSTGCEEVITKTILMPHSTPDLLLQYFCFNVAWPNPASTSIGVFFRDTFP